MSTSPYVMVSSTFYDLRQVRANLSKFISDELGYIPLLSELPSFPINPDLSTIDNCRARVENNADIFVLVIGGRYGSIDDATNKSITNLEFLAARQKGIPIYAFVERGILSVVPIWKKNRDADFSETVDTTQLFEFVEKVMSQDKVWTFPFDTAQDIVNILRIQFSYLFQESLKLRAKVTGKEFPPYLHSLSPNALRLALEKPEAWEYRLFMQCWADAVAQRSNLYREYRDKLRLDLSEPVPSNVAKQWMDTRLHELKGLVDSANRLLNDSARRAFGPPGESGDPEEIVWVSQIFGELLETTFRWSKRIRCAHVEKPFDKLMSELALFADQIITQLRTFPIECLRKIEEALTCTNDGERQELRLTMTIELANLDAFNKALSEILSGE
ncbi:DUF4062 domain-containing protein [Geobacter sulfurreducens]|uniref:DUF4062 domain-containing protein n=1 Tax=Geobacter sulfurreducens TaxID=35554 RepID=UPI002BE53421|nr:DUF4062 domain-containing protein [Geobacter sulfurreducens]HML77812.1 DUF4062 domain-containing protein [Geobacter sulfurreducens]